MPNDRILKTLHKRCAELGIPKVGPYHLRHTSATLALEAGVPLKAISERLGHTTIQLTADVYSHVTPKMDADAAAKLAVALGG